MSMIGKRAGTARSISNPVPTSVGKWSTIFKVLWRYLTDREERIPKRALGPFRTDARVYREPTGEWTSRDLDGPFVLTVGD